ncbi:DUF2142 domain-containing protein [Microbacterium azadirachtae]|uniref:DUF2142 domain-containing protein n=1 Tax=Microbacterium azadirachtae TaxID=582680 RepID=A0A0F0LUV3_9MICO|nr:DUF2142 domain-containing protein [Microbacterium azadirachtae]KJL36883.1 hypothetical protein RS86_00190 [Microbacterium azadirachtae]
MTRLSRLLITLLAGLAVFLSLGAWALSSPVGATPDEEFHLASIWCGSGPKEGMCQPGSDARHWYVPKKAVDAPCYAFKPDKNASCQGRSYLDEGFKLEQTKHVNAGSTQYPSGFYYWMSHLASDNIAVSTIVMRLVNAALFTVLLVGTWLLLPRRLRFSLSAGVALTAVPLAMFLIPSVNPSSWSIISIAVMFPALLGYFAAKGWRMYALGGIALLTALLGLGARGDSAAYAIVGVCAALALSFRNERGFYLRALLPVVMVVLAAFAFLGAGQTSLAINGMGKSQSTMSTTDLIVGNLLAMPGLWSGIYGLGWQLGWLDTALHPVVWAFAIFCVLGVLFVALRWRGWRKLVAVVGVGAAALLVPLYILVSSRVLVGYEVQPRYVLPLIILFVAVVLAPSEDPRGRDRGVSLSSAQIWTIAVLLTAANAVALYDNMHRYTGSGTLTLRGAVAWWWRGATPSPLVVWLIGSAAFALAMVVFALTATRRRAELGPLPEREGVRPAPTEPSMGTEPSDGSAPSAQPTESREAASASA